MLARAELVGPEQPKTALASLRLHPSNLAWASSFFRRGILTGSLDVPIRCKALQHEMPMRVELVEPKRPETGFVDFLVRSVSRQKRKTETKLKLCPRRNTMLPEQNMTLTWRRQQQGTAAHLDYLFFKVCSPKACIPLALCHTHCKTDR